MESQDQILNKKAEESISDLEEIMSNIRFERLTDPKFKDKKIVYIMRGIPGSGKSTVAREIAHPNGVLHSTDNKFIDENGVYRFDAKKIRENHDQVFTEFCEDIKSGVTLAVLDNTNIKKWEYERYKKYAEENGYIVKIIEMPIGDAEIASGRTVHGVSKEVIERMILNYEKE